MFKDFLEGAKCFLRGFNLVMKPGLRRFVLVPLIINALLFTAAIWLGIAQFDTLMDWLLPEGSSWWAEFARVVLWVFFAAGVLLILLFTFTVVANLIGAPFNGLLSEKVEGYLSGKEIQESGGIRDFISSIIPSILSELRKLVYFLILGGLLLILSLIPVVNVIAPFLWAVFASWMLALEYIAYPMENHRISFSQVRTGLKRKKMLALGFGSAAMAITLIPVVNFLVMPAAVAGATVMWTERLKGMNLG